MVNLGDFEVEGQATPAFTITVVDDIPILTGLPITRVVEEEMLDNAQSVGNPDDNDGPEDRNNFV